MKRQRECSLQDNKYRGTFFKTPNLRNIKHIHGKRLPWKIPQRKCFHQIYIFCFSIPEQCMDEMRKACGASECCRKLFQLDESQAKSNEEQYVSEMEDENSNTEEVTEEGVDEDEKDSGSSPSSDDYPGKKGLYLRSEDVKEKKRKGRVLELYPGKDGIIRLVKLRTEKGNILRPIQRLYPLELKPNYEQVVLETQKVPEVLTEHPELNTESYETAFRASHRMRNKTS
ncbi:hypothetical protein CEXT_299971 [Caerostris extrusa]|uniref:DUF5641 domain-containing protein n=1 Tax=Caerostris extrusa TaxID=172846 RepID=A0AAV4QMI5_CAEEX|nr:hypothetical protein CEXT_299971 [Caerostris extrusa]